MLRLMKAMALFFLAVCTINLLTGCTDQGETKTPENVVKAKTTNQPEQASQAEQPASPTEAVATPVDSSGSQAPVTNPGKADGSAMTSHAASSSSSPDDPRRVYFVKESGVDIFSKPNNKGQVVGHLTRGDHILAVLNGEWAVVNGNQYVKADSLSPQPVGRGKKPTPQWNTPSPETK